MDEEEIWKDIHHYEGIYQVSSCGRIRSVGRYVRNATSQYWRNGQIIKPWVGGTSPYYNVSLASDGKICKKLIHRLVAEHFLDDWNAAKEVNHKDGNKHNNRSDNLEMCTRQENVMHSMVHKLRDDYGENSVNAKLTNEQADHIRRLHRSGVMQNE
ncbi:NUMOD4 motif-containing HNH endonuclease, partial [Bacteroides uniformis]